RRARAAGGGTAGGGGGRAAGPARGRRVRRGRRGSRSERILPSFRRPVAVRLSGLVFLTGMYAYWEGGWTRSPGLRTGIQGMRQEEPGLGGPLGPLELIKHLPGEAFAASDRRRWVGLEAVRYREQPPNEAVVPPLTHHWLLLFLRTPRE